jgi:hypothetical protein
MQWIAYREKEPKQKKKKKKLPFDIVTEIPTEENENIARGGEPESYIGFLRCFSLLVRSDGAPKNPTSTAFPRHVLLRIEREREREREPGASVIIIVSASGLGREAGDTQFVLTFLGPFLPLT